MSAQIKSKGRVKATGEVFTAPREVQAMLDLIPAEEYANPLSTWLEPACGNGNFLVAILERKLSFYSGASDRPSYALKVVSALYGMDIAPDNVEEAIARLLSWLNTHVSCEEEFTAQARVYLEANILVGDFLNSSAKDKFARHG